MTGESTGGGCASKPLQLDTLLIQNVNSWGNVQYNIPLRLSATETRSSTSIGHRHIPDVPKSFDCKITTPLPQRLAGRDMVVEKESYRTTSGEYCVKPNPNKAMERSDCSINCRRVSFMTSVDKRLQNQTIQQPVMLSEMKDTYRGLQKSPLAPPHYPMNPPDPEYIFDVVACGRNEQTPIFDSDRGFRKLCDPYLSTYRQHHRPFTVEDQYGIGAKDHITFYTEFNTPKCRGFGPKFKEIWMPLLSKVHRGVYDRIHVKKECHEVASCHTPVNNLKGLWVNYTQKAYNDLRVQYNNAFRVLLGLPRYCSASAMFAEARTDSFAAVMRKRIFESEMKRKFRIPFTVSSLASWGHGESFDLPPFPPNPYQCNMAPFMYCSDYCHIAQGTPPYSVIDQVNHIKPHPPCKTRYVVSRDFEP